MIKKLIDKFLSNPFVYILLQKLMRGNIFEKVIRKECNQNYNSYILDLACGVGLYADLFNSKNYMGVDLDEKYIQYAQNKYPNKVFKVMDVRHINIKDSIFDTIIAVGLIHHLSDDDAFQTLKGMKNVSKKNGQIIIIDMIPPCSNYNIIGNVLISLDRGIHVRKMNDFINLFSTLFIVSKQYTIKRWPNEFCVFVLKTS